MSVAEKHIVLNTFKSDLGFEFSTKLPGRISWRSERRDTL